MERNLHETTNWWKTYGKQLFSKDLEVPDVVHKVFLKCKKSNFFNSLLLVISLTMKTTQMENSQCADTIIWHYVMSTLVDGFV
jgi:hypothetical protein